MRYMNAMNPSCKLIGLGLLTVLLPFLHSGAVNLAVFLLCVLLLLLARQSPKKLAACLLPVLLVAAGMFFTGYYFHAGDGAPVRAGSLGIGGAAACNGLMLSSRVLVIAGLGLLLALTTDPVRLIQSMRQQLRLPAVFAYGLLAAWGIFPHVVREYRQARLAFRVRGVRVSPVSPALLRPLLVKTVRWSEALSVAMESKGFDGSAPRTTFEPVALRRADILFPVSVIGLLAVAVLVKYHI